MTTARILVLSLLFALSSPCSADELTAAKRADIEKLLEMTGTAALGKQMGTAVMGQMAQAIRKMRPDIPQRVIDALPGEVGAVFEANMDAFKEQVIPLYSKYFTASEIKGMIAFYSTDLGKKTISVMPSLMAESMAAGQQWGQSLGPQIDARIKARCKNEGYPL
jgi:uncharacterized protein